MADFPALPQSPETQVTPVSGKTIDRADSGRVRGRSFYDGLSYDIDLMLSVVTETDKATLDAFYAANESETFTWEYDGDGSVFEVVFVAPPAYSWQGVDGSESWFTAKVSLAGSLSA